MATRQSSSIGLFALPLLVMGAIHVIVAPLADILSLSWVYSAVWYGIGFLIGFILMRRTRVTKDHEFRRSEIMMKMKHVYVAEAKGVWEKETPLQGRHKSTKNNSTQPSAHLVAKRLNSN